jgi:hypothetical protein
LANPNIGACTIVGVHDVHPNLPGFVIPEFVADDELEQFLFDLFHEQAAGEPGGIFRVQR